MKKTFASFVSLALVVGIAAGWFVRRQFFCVEELMPAQRQDMDESADKSGPASKASRGVARQVEVPKELRREIDALRQEVVQLEGEIAELADKEEKSKEREYFLASYMQEGIRTIADQKAKKPESYKITAESVKQQVDILKRNKDKYDEIVRSLDFSLLSESDREAHEKFMGHFAKTRDGFSRANAALADDDSLFKTYACDIMDAGDDRENLADARFGELADLISLSAWKRAKDVGLSDDDAAAVAETMRSIHEATDVLTF